ncbi:hypothetical protein ES703_119379 [subsurface metagenome]
MPQFDFLYTNADFTIVQGFTPLGDPDLKPAKTKAVEFGFKHSFQDKYFVMMTIFNKDASNLVDVNTYLHQNNYQLEMTGVSGLVRYVNVAYSATSGAELLVRYMPTDKLKGYLSYTYMHARGTSSSALEQYGILRAGYEPPENVIEYDLSWDQRHTVVFHMDYSFFKNYHLDMIYRWNSPLPYTKYTKKGSTYPNNSRMEVTSTFDLRIDRTFSLSKGKLVLTVQGYNLFDRSNILRKDRYGITGGYLNDPSAYDQRRRIELGLLYEH